MLDYIIVGLGLGGAGLAYRLEQKGYSFKIFDEGAFNSSRIAGGMMNPVILKRFTLAWRADEQLQLAESFYKGLEDQLDRKLISPIELYRKFSSVEEQNNWFEAADRVALAPFLDTELKKELSPAFPAPFSFGRVLHAQRVDTNVLLDSYSSYLEEKGLLERTGFDYDELTMSNSGISYKGLTAKKLVFCEGFGLRNNPFFNYLPLTGNKGEYIIIKAPDLQLNVTVKSSVFISPAGNDLYVVGATYNNNDKTFQPTQEARHEITAKLDKLVAVDYEIIDQIAGIRPTTADRRPLVGRHPEHDHLYCCNGFGSRGVLIAPMVTKLLLEHIEEGKALPSEIDLVRFSRRYAKST